MCKIFDYIPTATTLKNNITDLSKVILNCRKLTDENNTLLELARQELNKILA
jgi:hypothetical protein